MTGDHIFVVWIGCALVIALAGCLLGGMTDDDDLAGVTVFLAVVWPFVVVASLLVLPFFLTFKLGRWIDQRRRQALKEGSHHG